MSEGRSILADLEARQDDIILQLDELNRRIEFVIAEFTSADRDAPTC